MTCRTGNGKDESPERVAALKQAVLAGDRAAIAKAITLVESTRADDRRAASALIQGLLDKTGKSLRIGITGVPGVGKSTFIEALGTQLADAGRKVAVLAVDPTSEITGGSILGDKTRMADLAAHENAFVRPTPSSGKLGGVAARTREAVLIVEAAGYDTVFVETVGAGQSEAEVADLVDIFAVLLLPGAGDELQGIKKGVLEVADLLIVNKADRPDDKAAKAAIREYKSALHIMAPREDGWRVPVLACSARDRAGLDKVWATIEDYEKARRADGGFKARRQAQAVKWMWAMVEEAILERAHAHPRLKAEITDIEAGVSSGKLSPAAAAQKILGTLAH